MRNNLENNSVMLKPSDEPKRLSDSLSGNQYSSTLEQLKHRAKEQEKKKEIYIKIENQERNKADTDLENALSSLGVIASKDEIEKNLEKDIDIEGELSIEEEIKSYAESIRDGKSQTEVLKMLISEFENENGVETLVNNFRNFLKLHQFAENKPSAEQQAIQRIISNADFSNENAFAKSLNEISNSSDISTQTKLEISRKFDGTKVSSVNQMDAGLKHIKLQKKQIEKQIGMKSREKNSLENDIDNLEDELKNLSQDATKRQELEKKLKQKKGVLKQTESEIENLEQEKSKNISFKIRDGFQAKLYKDGSRSIVITSADFSIKLPSNFLPLTGTKNLNSINLAFPYLALRSQNIAKDIFSPNIENDSVPSKEQRKMSHMILKSLGIDDSKILSEIDISRMNTDLSRLTASQAGKTGQECLIDLGIFDISSQSVNKSQLEKALKFICENRDLRDDVFFAGFKTHMQEN